MKKTVFTFAALPSFDAIDAALFWNLAFFIFILINLIKKYINKKIKLNKNEKKNYITN